MKERQGMPLVFISCSKEIMLENNSVIFDAKREKDLRHNKNLHGEGRYVKGLTGFYHRKYYRNGRHQPNKRIS